MSTLIIGNIGENHEALEELAGRSLADDVSLIAEDERTPGEVLAEFIYDDFVKAR